MVETELKPYDIAALILIVTGAGGVVTNWEGKPAQSGGRIIAAGDARAHEAALKLLEQPGDSRAGPDGCVDRRRYALTRLVLRPGSRCNRQVTRIERFNAHDGATHTIDADRGVFMDCWASCWPDWTLLLLPALLPTSAAAQDFPAKPDQADRAVPGRRTQ